MSNMSSCCECQHNKCNRDRESRFVDVLFWVCLFGVAYYLDYSFMKKQGKKDAGQ